MATEISRAAALALFLSFVSGVVAACDGDAPGAGEQGATTSGGAGGEGAGAGATTGGGGSGGEASDTFAISVLVSDLRGEISFALSPGDEPLSIADDGEHPFAAALEDGTDFAVTIVAQPGLQTCSSDASSGTIDGSDVVVTFRCHDHVVFSGRNSDTNDHELWASDTTEAGTHLIKNIAPQNSSYPRDFLRMDDGRVFFTADDETHGRELWVSQGSEATTMLVRDIAGGGSSSGIDAEVMHAHAGRLYFAATDDDGERELWVSDGTEAGTMQVADLNPGPGSSHPWGLASAGERLVFQAYDGNEVELFALEPDGSTVVGLGASAYDFVGEGFDGRVYFDWEHPVAGRELSVTDGTPGGTVIVADLAAGATSASPYPVVAGMRLFAADSPVTGYELHVTDGNTATLVLDIAPGAASGYPENLAGEGRLAPSLTSSGVALFTADDGTHGKELWASDGTETGTQMIADIVPGAAGSSVISYLGELDGVAILYVYTTASALWRSDGTPSGTSELVTFSADTYLRDVYGAAGGKVCFGLQTPDGGAELYCSDGTASGTVRVIDLCPGTCHGLVVAG